MEHFKIMIYGFVISTNSTQHECSLVVKENTLPRALINEKVKMSCFSYLLLGPVWIHERCCEGVVNVTSMIK